MTKPTGLEIAVIGMAGRFPGARSVDQLWQRILQGSSAIATFTDAELAAAGVPRTSSGRREYVAMGGVLDDAELFDADFFGYTPRDAAVLDPQQRVFLECAWHAMENAGCAGGNGDRLVGVYAGASLSTYLLRHLLPNQELRRDISDHELILSNDKDTLATRVAYHLNLAGPAVGVHTSCSTSLVAIHLACQALLSRDCDVALAGGVSIRLPQQEGYLYRDGHILSPDGRCRPFDAAAQGTVGGNGAGVVVLKPLADALDNGDTIRAVIVGSAINNDGAGKVGFTAPSVDGQAMVIRTAHEMAGVDPATVGYIEAHGTATPMGDPIEVAALTQAFTTGTDVSRPCALGSVKALIGHLDAAAGVAGFIKAVLAIEHGVLPPSPYFERPNPALDLENSPFFVNTELLPWPSGEHPRRAGVSSFGMGGTNAHVVLEQADPRGRTESSRPHQVLLLSARSAESLAQSREQLRNAIATTPDAPMADVAHTLRTGRRTFTHRLAVVCASQEDAVNRLALPAGEGIWAGEREANWSEPVFLFPGQGSQHIGLAAGLYRSEPVFRRHLDECAELLLPSVGRDIRELVYPAGEGSSAEAEQLLTQTRNTQPVLFSVEYALARLWQEWGVRPKAMIGHSVGEYVAACLAGTFDLPAAAALVAARGRLIQGLPPGAMLTVSLPAADIARLLGPGLALAAANGPRLSVVSGPPEDVERLERELTSQEITHRQLRTSHAFHSPMMEPILDAFAAELTSTRMRPPAIPFVSNVTGQWITPEQATDPGYWVRHLREPVRFSEGIRLLLRDSGQILLEVGPGNTLGTLVRQHGITDGAHTVLSTLPHPRDTQPDTACVASTLGRLWLAGAAIDFDAYAATDGAGGCLRVPLPDYPFQRRRHWFDLSASVAPSAVADVPSPVAALLPTRRPGVYSASGSS